MAFQNTFDRPPSAPSQPISKTNGIANRGLSLDVGASRARDWQSAAPLSRAAPRLYDRRAPIGFENARVLSNSIDDRRRAGKSHTSRWVPPTFQNATRIPERSLHFGRQRQCRRPVARARRAPRAAHSRPRFACASPAPRPTAAAPWYSERVKGVANTHRGRSHTGALRERERRGFASDSARERERETFHKDGFFLQRELSPHAPVSAPPRDVKP